MYGFGHGTHLDEVGITLGRIRLIRVAGGVGVHHGDIVIALSAIYVATIAHAEDVVAAPAATHEIVVSRAGHDIAPISLIIAIICPVNLVT